MARRLSSWVNIQDVFRANKGEGTRMNEDVFGSLEAEGEQARQRMRDASQGFERQRNKGVSDAWDRMGDATATAAKAEAGSKQTYRGPRTLREYDPNVGNDIADAAARINASPDVQFQQRYKGVSAGGSALDRALMGGEGGAEREQKLRGTYGGLLDELRGYQQQAQMSGAASERAVNERAAQLAAMVPQLRQLEEEAARQKYLEDVYRRNTEARAAYDKEYDERNLRFRRRRGNQLQAAYQPPEAERVDYAYGGET